MTLTFLYVNIILCGFYYNIQIITRLKMSTVDDVLFDNII